MTKNLKPTIQGFGIKDVDYVVAKYEDNGKQKRRRVWICSYYCKWKDMIVRCSNKRYLEKYPSYKGCSVYEDWRYLSKFIEWVDNQPNKDWTTCHLDKDFLVKGNKVYSPETCVFISSKVNTFITDRGGDRGECMIGVLRQPNLKINPYISRCSNPFTNKREHLGCYPTEIEAHLAWQSRKHELALQLAEIQVDTRVASRLREIYAPDKDWSNK